MEYRQLGDSDVKVSAIALGCWIVGMDWWGHYSDADGVRLMACALDQGISFFDNGDAYGNGRAENVLGQFLHTVPRDKVQVGSKFGYDFHNDPGEAGSHRERRQDFSPQFMRTSLERSLRRLGVDYLDLYMAHNIKLPQFRDDLFDELGRLRQQGKIRAWGVSLGPPIGWREEGFAAVMKHGAQAVQTVFNLFEQHPGRELCQVACAHQAGVLARVHDNSGILKGNMRLSDVIGNDDHRKFRDQRWKAFGLQKLELVRPLAEAHGMTVHQLACRWLLQQPGLASVTATLLNEREIIEAARAAEKPPLTAEELRKLHEDYQVDWNLGDEAHPCDLKSSIHKEGKVRSQYVSPPMVIA